MRMLICGTCGGQIHGTHCETAACAQQRRDLNAACAASNLAYYQGIDQLRADLAAARAEVERAAVLLDRVRVGGLSRDLTSNRDLAKDIRAYLAERDIPPQGQG